MLDVLTSFSRNGHFNDVVTFSDLFSILLSTPSQTPSTSLPLETIHDHTTFFHLKNIRLYFRVLCPSGLYQFVGHNNRVS